MIAGLHYLQKKSASDFPASNAALNAESWGTLLTVAELQHGSNVTDAQDATFLHCVRFGADLFGADAIHRSCRS